MSLMFMAEEALPAPEEPSPSKSAWFGFALASLISAASAGSWIVLILQSR